MHQNNLPPRFRTVPVSQQSDQQNMNYSNNQSYYQYQQQIPQQQVPQQQDLNMSSSSQSSFTMNTSIPQMNTSGSVAQNDESKNVMKLIKLFRSFQGLCLRQNATLNPTLIKLTEQTIQGTISAKEYETKISEILGHNPNSNLVGFLEKALPLLRNEIQAGRCSIESIITKPKQMVQESPSPQTTHGVTASPQSMPGPSPLQRPAPSPIQPPNSDPSQRNIPESPMNRPPASAPTIEHANQYQNRMDAGPFPPASTSQSMQYTPIRQIVPKSEPGVSVIPKSEPGISLVKMEPSSIASTIPQTIVQTETTIVGQVTTQSFTSMVPPSNPNVVPMEQSAPTEVAYKEISSEAPDKSIFDRQSFAARLHRKMPECEAFEENVLMLFSDYLEVKLKELIQSSVAAAEHRLEPLNQKAGLIANCDPKKQLQMIERFEKAEKQKREFLERENILKASKGKSKDADMLEKAKQLKKADQEELSNKQTNEAAIAALAGTKRQWPSKSNTSANANLQRFRKKHITMRDLMYVFERDPVAKHSVVFRKMLYGLSPE